MAQILTLDTGVHNSDIVKTNARLTATGNWKKQRIIMLVPGDMFIPAKAYLAHRGLIFPPNQAMTPMMVRGAEVGAAYEVAIDIILDNPELSKWEYILTIEHDNIPSPTGVLDLLVHMEAHPEMDAISGLYFTKGEGGAAQIWGDINDPQVNYRPQVPQPPHLVECYGIGQGFALWRMNMFKELRKVGAPKPWFRTVAGMEGVGTQDLYFWGNVARKYGFRCGVACNVPVGHLDPQTEIVW